MYGKRVDGTLKGNGYFGPIQTPRGVMTENSIGVGFDGVETQIPTVIPTLTGDELQSLINGNLTDIITRKAIDYAIERKKQGLSPFAQDGEQQKMLKMDGMAGPMSGGMPPMSGGGSSDGIASSLSRLLLGGGGDSTDPTKDKSKLLQMLLGMQGAMGGQKKEQQVDPYAALVQPAMRLQ